MIKTTTLILLLGVINAYNLDDVEYTKKLDAGTERTFKDKITDYIYEKTMSERYVDCGFSLTKKSEIFCASMAANGIYKRAETKECHANNHEYKLIFSKFGFLNGGGACQIFDSAGKLMVVYKGTESLEDLIQDTKTNYTPLKIDGVQIANVFEGFNQIPNDMCFTELIELHKRIHTINDVLFTGHSYGGSLALTAGLAYTEKFKATHKDKIPVITFGQPKIGDETVPIAINNRLSYLRLKRKDDVIPSWPILKGTHSNNRVVSMYKQTYTCSGEDIYGTGNLDDHSMEGYMIDLHKIFGKEVEKIGF